MPLAIAEPDQAGLASATAARSLSQHPVPRKVHRGLISTVVIVVSAVLLTIAAPARPILLWNASPSSPEGLYLVWPATSLRKGDMAIAWPPPAARELAADRNYLPFAVPLVKRVAATAGARVCGKGRWALINGSRAAKRLRRDPSGRPLSWWKGCVTLKPGEFLLLSPDRPDAFDGRYFGVSHDEDIVGRAKLLWPY